MWYEVLPPLAIIGGCLYAGLNMPYFFNKWVLGENPMRRDLTKFWDSEMFVRDAELHGIYASKEGWRSIGLENIPDKK